MEDGWPASRARRPPHRWRRHVLRFARDARPATPAHRAVGAGDVDRRRRRRGALTALGDGARATSSASSRRSAPTWSSSCRLLRRPAVSIRQRVTTTPRDLTIDDAAALLRCRWCPPRGAACPSATLEISAAGGCAKSWWFGDAPPIRAISSSEDGPGRAARGRLEPRRAGRRHRRESRRTVRRANRRWRTDPRRRPPLRVVGVLKSIGQGLGMNTDELVIVPVALAPGDVQLQHAVPHLIEANRRRYPGRQAHGAGSWRSPERAIAARRTSPSSPRTPCWPPSTAAGR